MKSKLTNRILAAFCVAIVLSVLLALTSFAAEIQFNGTVFEGLDPNKTYGIAPYAMLGADTSKQVTVTGVEECDITEKFTDAEGLYGIYVIGDEANVTPGYIQAKYTTLKEIGNFVSGSAKPLAPEGHKDKTEWITGYFTKHHNSVHAASPTFNGYNFLCDWRYYVDPQTIHAAMKTSSTFDDAAALEFAKEKFRAITINYAYSADEVVPVNMLGKMNFRSYKKADAGHPLNIKAQPMLEVYVMGTDGKINTYSILGEKYAHNGPNSQNNATNIEINVQDIENLPEEGWIVAWTYYPIYEFNFSDITTTSLTDTDTHYPAYTWVGYGDYYEILLPKEEKPVGITVEGTTFKGLDATKSYAVAPYAFDGVQSEKAIIIEGKSEYDLRDGFPTAGGLYGIYVSGGDYARDSDAILVYVYGNYKARADIIELTPDNKLLIKSGSSEFIPGYVSHNTATYTGYGTYGCIADGHLATEYSKAMWEARQNGDTAKAKATFESIREQGHKYVFRYALTTEEIIPITDVNYYTFGILRQMGTYNLTNNTIRFDALIMDNEGTINTYTRYYKNQLLSATEVLYKVDFESDEGWETPLPKDGYFVGYAVYPYWDIGSEEDLVFTISAPPANWYNTRCQFRHVPNGYSIDIPAAELPEGVSVEGTVFKGLDATQKYLVSPYTLLGADEDNSVTVTGVTEYDIKDAFPVPGGLYGLAIPGDEYFTASKAIYVYISGPSATRKELGTLMEKTYTWNNGADSKTMDVPTNAKVKESDKVWEIGSYLGSDYYFYNGGDHNCMKSDWMYYPTTSKALYEAELAGEAALKAEREKAQKVIQAISNRYAFTSDEIIPINEVFEMSFTRAAGTVEITVLKGSAKYVFMIMDPADGKITEYTHIGEYKAFGGDINNSSRVEKLDIRALIKEGVLPSEGLLVGYKYYPLGVVNLEDITYKNQTGTGDQFAIDTRFPHFYFKDSYVIKEEAPTPELKTFPLIEGGYGEISGLNPRFIYEVQYYDEATSTWSEWDKVDEGATAFRVYNTGTYRVRVIETENNLPSDVAEIVVKAYETEYKPYKSQIVTMHLPNDFVELSAEYEMDVTVKNWVSSLALANIKTAAPESIINIIGDGYKFAVVAKNINLDGNKTHYFDMAVSFDGESRFDNVHKNLKELAGERYVKEVFFESTAALPFEEAEFMVFVGEDKTGADVELRSYNSRINKLRKVETSTVIDGWVTFTNYTMPYVILQKN